MASSRLGLMCRIGEGWSGGVEVELNGLLRWSLVLLGGLEKDLELWWRCVGLRMLLWPGEGGSLLIGHEIRLV